MASRALQAASFLQNEGCLKVTYYVKLIQTQGARGPVAGPAQITNLTISPYHEPAITNLWSRTRNHEFAPWLATKNRDPSATQLPKFPSLARVFTPCADGVSFLGITDGFRHFEHPTPLQQRLLPFPAPVRSPELGRMCKNSLNSSSNWNPIVACVTTSIYG